MFAADGLPFYKTAARGFGSYGESGAAPHMERNALQHREGSWEFGEEPWGW
jgi:hypothetical protein